MKGRIKPYLVMAAVLAVTIALGWIAMTIVMDNDVKIFFPYDHESYVRIRDLEDTYGSSVLLDICISTDEDSLLTWQNLDMIRELAAELEELNYVESVTALTNTDYPVGTDDGMSVLPLVPEDVERTQENLDAIKNKLLDWSDMYGRTLYSEDFKATQMIVSIDEKIHSEELGVLYDEVMVITDSLNTYPISIVVAGNPVLSQVGKDYMYRDLTILIPFVIIVLFLCLFFSFRKLSATLLPLITVSIATIWTVGTMALFGVEFTVISSCLPVLIIAVGSAYGIHVVNHFYHMKKQSDSMNIREIISHSVKDVALPVFLAGFTTIIGFLSILSSPVVPLKAFGAFAAMGTVYSLVLSLALIPAMLEVFERRHAKKNGGDIDENAPERNTSIILNVVLKMVQKYKKTTVFILLVMTGFSLWGLVHINVESALISYFPYDSPIRQDSRYIGENFGGTNTFSVVIDAEEGYDLTNPEALKVMDDLKQYLLEKHPGDIGKIMAYSDYIKRMNQIMNYPIVEAEAEAEAEAPYDDSGWDEADDSFGDSFFGDDDAFGADAFGESFFGDDTMAAETGSVGETEIEFLPLSRELDAEELIMLLQQSFAESGDSEMSVAELNRKIQELTNYRGAAYYEIPWELEKYPVGEQEELSNLISQYLLLYSGSLDDFANDSLKPTQARMSVQMTTYDTSVVKDVIEDVELYCGRYLPEGYVVSNTGIAEMQLALTNMITDSQITSLLLALVAVFLIVAITYKSPVAGLMGIIPLGFSILVNFGLMSLLDINLDMVTSLIASIAIGVGVDYTIHLLSRYKKERALSSDLKQVTDNTIHSTGRGILINAVSVGLGFFVLVFSRFIVLRYIGLLVAVIMGTSSLGALIILPMLLNKLDPKFMRPVEDKDRNKAKRKRA